MVWFKGDKEEELQEELQEEVQEEVQEEIKEESETMSEDFKYEFNANTKTALINLVGEEAGIKSLKRVKSKDDDADILEAINKATEEWNKLPDEEKDNADIKVNLYKKARREIGVAKRLVLVKEWAKSNNVEWKEEDSMTISECYGYSEKIKSLKEELVALGKLIPAIEELGKWKSKTTIKIPVSPSTVAKKIEKRKDVINGYKSGGIKELQFRLDSAIKSMKPEDDDDS